MCLILNWNLFSPLEQFEISSYNTFLNYVNTFSINICEHNYILVNNLGNLYSYFDLFIIFVIVYFLQNVILQRGFIFLFIFILSLLACINIYAFNDFIIQNTYAFSLSNKFSSENLLNNFEAGFQYYTLNTSFINIYSVFFCFVFIYLIMYLFFNKSISNNTNGLIPNMYQVIMENIYKVSLELFYSVLGKHVNQPEFFIKINTLFVFLIISNVQGMIPYMSTLTSALTNTFFIALALFISIIITLLDKKGINYFLNLFMPSGCPIFLVLLLIPIELISYSFRVVSLSVRLFANMMAGHTLLKVIVGFSWVIISLMDFSFINLFPILILFILTLLEFGVALIQAYIFTVLSCIYLRDIFEGH